MRFEHNGMSLWYGTPDAPAPGEVVAAGAEVAITVGVQPAGASNKVEVLYRVNQGATQTVAARFFRNDVAAKAQYFRARLPAFRAGDTVEYTVACRCAGRQVSSSDDPRQFASSFRVAEARPVSALALKEGLARGPVMPAGLPALAAPHAKSLSVSAAPSSSPSQVPSDGRNVVTQPARLAPKARANLSALLATSSLGADPRMHDKFISLHAEHKGATQEFWSKLRQEPEFKAPGVVEDIQFTLQLGLLTGNHVPLVKTLQNLRRQGAVQSPRDLVKLDTSAWTQLVNTSANGQATKVPPNVPGGTHEEKVANYVNGIVGTLKTAFPTTAFAQSISTPPTVDQRLVKTVLARNPNLDPADHPPANLDWRGMSADDQANAKASLATLRQEIKMFPGFDYKAVLTTSGGNGSRTGRGLSLSSTLQNPVRDGVVKFLANSPDFDFRTAHIDSYLAENAATAFQDIPEADRAAVTDQLKRQQRIFRVTPNHEAASAMMAEGLHSAYSISSIPQAAFLKQFSDKLGGRSQALAVHSKAEHVTASALNVYTQVHQALHDVTPRVIGNVADGVKEALKQHPNLDTLFGSLSFCDCDHCRSVYSPAAYFVDLLQFLNPKIWSYPDRKRPIEVLLQRRPDLAYIKLNCENTNTLIPYVDLVNEILESYVALGHLDATAAHDTGDSTADELSANPQYVNDTAYDILKKAVYPLTLPFNRPLEVARTYLEHLGSSRYQVMQTFQKGGNPTDPTKGAPSGLAIACEYLKISSDKPPAAAKGPSHGPLEVGQSPAQQTARISVEERAILTGTDESGAPLPPPPKSPALSEFYGYDPQKAIDDLKTALKQVPEFLRATGISYLDLIALVKTRFLNPKQAITLDVPSEADPCDLSQTTIENLDEGALKKMHRFIRLWRKLGWEIRDLDKAMTALGATDIDDPLLQKLAHVKRLQADLKLPLDQLLTFWTNIDTDGRDCLYIKLFQNKAVLNPVDSAFALKDDGAELSNSGGPISDHVNTILAALRISATDLAAIRDATKLAVRIEHSRNQTLNPPVKDRGGRLRDADLAAPLNLANLSKLYRHALLARALKLSVKDFLALLTLTGITPFQAGDPGSTTLFMDKVQKVRQSTFSVTQLNYLYRHVYDTNRGIAPLQANVDLLLKNLQTGLKKIIEDTTVVADPTGDLLRQKLAVVLDSSLVDPAMGLMGGAAVYFAHLDSLPDIKLPDSAKNKISYDGNNKQLRFTGAMTDTEKADLWDLSGDANYRGAISDLYQQPRALILTYATPLSTLPDLTFPDSLKGKISYDIKAKDLRFVGAMTGAEKTQLLALSMDSDYQTAINILFQQPGSSAIPTGMAAFLDPADAVSQIINNAKLTQTDRFNYVLTRLMTFLRNSLSRSLIKQTLSDKLKLESGLMNLLLDGGRDPAAPALLKSQADKSRAAILDFLALATLAPPDAAAKSYHLLHKVRLLIDGFKMGAREVAYLSAHGADFQGVNPNDKAEVAPFDLNELPLDPADFKVALFSQWERLCDLFTLRDSLPQGEVGLLDVFGAASLDDAKAKLILVTGWDSKELDVLTGTDGFKLGTDDFKNEIALVRLQACWVPIKRLGVSATQLFDWASKLPCPCQAQAIKNTVKAKYDDPTWLTVAKPLNDKLRESQKAALIAYLLTKTNIQAQDITDSSGLYEYFLIDVDMSACMMTSRIVQANSSVQLFVQRCLMNLEPGVFPSAIDDGQWKWMKYYRVWEANRKVFLYPENWIESELRDNKTPFFKELESELLQNDVTTHTAERALLNYLEKLDDVARLEICGMYWQDEDPGTPEGVNILHVFGRTFAVPHIYYYRQLVNNATWTPWEKVQVDIEGDHLIPTVWNRRLYLFWPIFTEKADPKENKPSDSPSQPKTHREIQLAWSEYKDGKWSPKRLSTGLIKSSRFGQPIDDRPPVTYSSAFSDGKALAGLAFATTVTRTGQVDYLPEPQYHFFGVDASDNELYIHACRRFRSASASVTTKIDIALVSSGDNILISTDWTQAVAAIASAFMLGPVAAFPALASDAAVFADSVIKTTPPRSRIPNYERTIVEEAIPVDQCEHLAYFDFTGCNGRVDVVATPSTLDLCKLHNPENSSNVFMSYAEDAPAKSLTLLDVGSSAVRVLGTSKKIPSPYTMLYAHQRPLPHPHKDSPYYPFFYQDKQRAYLVTPNCVDLGAQLSQPDAVEPTLQASYQNDAVAAPTEATKGAQAVPDASAFSALGPAADSDRGMMALARPGSDTGGTTKSMLISRTQGG